MQHCQFIDLVIFTSNKNKQVVIITATLETGGGLGPKCVPQLFLKSLLGTLLAIFLLSLVTVSEVFTKTNSAPSLRSLQAILPKILCAPDVALLRKRVSRGLMRDTNS